MFRKKLMLAFVLTVAVAAVSALSATRESAAENPSTYDLKTFLNPDWELAMHEVFTHYLQAAATFGEGNYETSLAFLKVMAYYINMLPDIVPTKTPDNKPADRAAFLKNIDMLRQNNLKLQQLIEKKEYKKVTEMAPDYITKLCADCHKNAKVPPKWQIGGYKVND